jgi:hypothetical protein
MKKQTSQFFANLFSGAKGQPSESVKTTPVVITSYSQPHVLQQRMKEEKLTHGETVTVNISPVRLENAYGKMVMYFCPMQTIEILKHTTPGDGGNIPIQATVDGLSVPGAQKPGLYTLKNVQLSSNGTIQVTATAKTAWEVV